MDNDRWVPCVSVPQKDLRALVGANGKKKDRPSKIRGSPQMKSRGPDVRALSGDAGNNGDIQRHK